MVATAENTTRNDPQANSTAPAAEPHTLLGELLGPSTGASWRLLVQTAADMALAAPWSETFDPLNALVERVKLTDRALAMEIDSTVSHLATHLTTRYALLGYALAKTWPDSAEELDDWAERARAFVGE